VPGDGTLLGVSTLVFTIALTGTIAGSTSMSPMGEMTMPGGWTMSTIWMRMPGESWVTAWAAFAGMWAVMMVAMMLPSLMTVLQRYRRGVAGVERLGELTLSVAAGYFAVWIGLGLAVFPISAGLGAVVMRRPAVAEAVPLLAGAVVALAGALQFTRFKARHLVCCREAHGRDGPQHPSGLAAWWHGVGLGLHCARCCAGFMAILLVMGVMDLRVMAAVAAAITIERVAPEGVGARRAIGGVAVGAGLLLVGRAAGLG
jgi:predicted metal-binding membrane protein